MRQAKFRISMTSICVTWTQFLLNARTRYPYNAHRRLCSDCASVIRLHLAHMYFVKYCFAAAYECQPSSFFGHPNPAHIVTSCHKSGRGCRQARQTKLSYIVLTLQKHALHQCCSSEYYDNKLFFLYFRCILSSFRANCAAV